MTIYTSLYTLIRKKDRSFQNGSLIKIEDGDGHWGVADICPQVRLGDLKLEDEIKKQGPLFQRAVVLAKADLLARKCEVKLFNESFIQFNHLATDFSHNYSGVVKVKGDQNFSELLEFLSHLDQALVRLDFNSKLSDLQFSELIPQLPKNIEYVEDPTRWNEKLWTKWNQAIPLAFDFAEADPFLFPNAWSHLIIKPSRQDADRLVENCWALNKKFTLTSAMDHPVGFAHGMHYAQKYQHHCSGFSTLEMFESTVFSSYFEVSNNKVRRTASADFGIGMTEILNAQNWKLLL